MNLLAIVHDDAVAVTPNDSTAQFTSPAAGLVVAASGTVTLKTARGRQVQVYCLAGYPLDLAFVQVYATGTSATIPVALLGEPFRGTT